MADSDLKPENATPIAPAETPVPSASRPPPTTAMRERYKTAGKPRRSNYFSRVRLKLG